MLSSKHLQTVEHLTGQLNSDQLAWLSGYLAGIHKHSSTTLITPDVTTTQTADTPVVTVLYGSQSGNGKTIADELVTTINARGLKAIAFSSIDYKTARLKKERFLLVVISTHGEGEPPDAATAFYTFLHSARAPELPDLRYSVLALGDSSYEFFCQTGRDIDARLSALGASPLTKRVECDADFEREATLWKKEITEALIQTTTPTALPNSSADVLTLEQSQCIIAPVSAYDRQHPFSSPLLENILLTLPSRQTRHLEFSLEGSELRFTPGDCLGVWPRNPQALAEQTAATLKLNWDAVVILEDEKATAAQWLQQRLEITFLTPAVLANYHTIVGGDTLATLVNDRTAALRYLKGRYLLDVLTDFPPSTDDGTKVLGCLRRLTPRLYSLASSLFARENEAHILIAQERYSGFDDSSRTGVCSDHLIRLTPGDTAQVFIQKNDNFRLPANDNTPLIMISAGTGVAPFRSFMEEREERCAKGKNWLFFGERRRREDFYYQTEWQEKIKNGALNKLSAAFSRDNSHKTYVQDKIREQGEEFWKWLKSGAYVYICGSDSPMAKDVHQVLTDVIEEHGGISGSDYLAHLRESGRYQRDVY
jgi:sulfite reductase (NADPH) flavoprotein alpha-component